MTLIKDVARKAAELALDEHWDGQLPVDPVKIARALGMSIWLADLPDNESGLISKRAGEPAAIYLNKNEPPSRQNFTCAHELGHWYERDSVADDEYSFVDRRDDRPKDAHEWYAEHFAANLLMPMRAFIQAVDDGLPLWELETKFGVSRAAAGNRARNLGLKLNAA